MLPASSDDFHQQLRFPDDNSPRFPEQRRETQEHEPSGKSKKKGKGSKGKDKGAKASAKSPFEELYAFSAGIPCSIIADIGSLEYSGHLPHNLSCPRRHLILVTIPSRMSCRLS